FQLETPGCDAHRCCEGGTTDASFDVSLQRLPSRGPSSRGCFRYQRPARSTRGPGLLPTRRLNVVRSRRSTYVGRLRVGALLKLRLLSGIQSVWGPPTLAKSERRDENLE